MPNVGVLLPVQTRSVILGSLRASLRTNYGGLTRLDQSCKGCSAAAQDQPGYPADGDPAFSS